MTNGLRELGLQRDDRVAVFLESGSNLAAIFDVSGWGRIRAREPVLRPAQVAYILADCRAVLVTSPERLNLMKREVKGCLHSSM
jgi:hypothetical protein